MTRNQDLINKTVEITVAKLSNSNVSANKEGGERVAEFMQEIYNKLVDLSEKENYLNFALADISSARAFVISANSWLS